MKHYKNINGSLFAAFFPVMLIAIGSLFALVFPYRQAVVILAIPIAFLFVGNIFILISKWNKIANNNYTSLGPSSNSRILIFFYRTGYGLIGIGLFLALIKLI